MATWDSADLLTRFRDFIGRPDTDEDLTDVEAYRLLSQAQERVTADLAAHVPETNYGAPELMTTADNKVYTVANDAIGHIEVYPDLKSPPLRCGAFWDSSADFTQEGPKSIRITSDRTRTFSAGPYARYVRANPAQLSATQVPTLQPDHCRILIVYDAAVLWALRGGRRDPAPYLAAYSQAWESHLTALKTQYFGQGAASYADASGWWRSGDLGG